MTKRETAAIAKWTGIAKSLRAAARAMDAEGFDRATQVHDAADAVAEYAKSLRAKATQ